MSHAPQHDDRDSRQDHKRSDADARQAQRDDVASEDSHASLTSVDLAEQVTREVGRGRSADPRHKPIISELFATQLRSSALANADADHFGQLPDVVIRAEDIVEALEAELVGIQVTVPSMTRWGQFEGADQLGEEVLLRLNTGEVTVQAATPVHVPGRTWALDASHAEIEGHGRLEH
ncbi:MAG: hypothetical protein Q4G40_01785 [Brachybacterium sp.]|nr:hypothetical protein [Brachybacterium sp.]